MIYKSYKKKNLLSYAGIIQIRLRVLSQPVKNKHPEYSHECTKTLKNKENSHEGFLTNYLMESLSFSLSLTSHGTVSDL